MPSFSLFLDPKGRRLSGDEIKLITGHQTSIGITQQNYNRLSLEESNKGTCVLKENKESIQECQRNCAAALIMNGICKCRLSWFEGTAAECKFEDFEREECFADIIRIKSGLNDLCNCSLPCEETKYDVTYSVTDNGVSSNIWQLLSMRDSGELAGLTIDEFLSE